MNRKRKASAQLDPGKENVQNDNASAPLSAREFLARRTREQSKQLQKESLDSAGGLAEVNSRDDLDYDSEEGLPNDLMTDDLRSIPEELEPEAEQVLSTWSDSIPASLQTIDNYPDNISLSYQQTLTIVGQYELQVEAGVVSVCGTVLTAKSGVVTVEAPSTEALPVITSMAANTAELTIFSVSRDHGFECLGKTNPLFSNIWRCTCQQCKTRDQFRTRSYTILKKSSDYHIRRITALTEPNEWMQYMFNVAKSANPYKGQAPIAITGTNFSGKSSFLRHLINAKLSPYDDNSKKIVHVLELDSEKPLAGLPGYITATQHTMPILGPSWFSSLQYARTSDAYPVGLGNNRVSKEEFLRIAKHQFQSLALFARSRKEPPVAFYVHLPSWSAGTGQALVQKLLEIITPDKAIFIGLTEDQVPLTTGKKQERFFLPAIPTSVMPPVVRSPADRQLMNIQAYFHNPNERLRDQPISTWRPQTLSYTEGGELRAVFLAGDIQFSKQNMLSRFLNGNMVVIQVAVADAELSIDPELSKDELIPYSKIPPELFEHPQVLPCGPGIIRSIDVANKTLQIITPHPFHPRDGRVFLTVGYFDAPGWAYLQAHHMASEDGNTSGTDRQSSTPWVEFMEK